MATVTRDSTPYSRLKSFFPEKVLTTLEAEDNAAGKAVALIILAIISFGLVSMIVSLGLAL